MDKEYVGREEVIKILEHYDLSSGSTLGYHSGAIECAISEIEMLPAADVEEVRHGRWVKWAVDIPERPYHCSSCGWSNHHIPYSVVVLLERCPHCGAKMDKEEV